MVKLDEYINGIKNGSIVCGREVKLAVERFESDLLRDDLEFRYESVQFVVEFIENIKHYKGKHINKPFILEGWELFIVANIFGFYWKYTGLRRFTSSYIEIARKNGKTAFAVAICLYALIADNEASAEVILAANSKEQAKIAFDIAVEFAKKLDPQKKYLKPYRSEIKFGNNLLKVIASDDSKQDGFNCSFGIVDEYHAAKTSKIRDVIKSSMGMREQPHLCTITTAGFDKTLPCYQLRTVAIEVLNKLKTDDSMFIMIFSLDVNDDWRDPANWLKSNPNLGITVRKNFIEQEVQKAINNPQEETGVRTKNINEWTDTIEVWIPETYIIESSKDINVKDFPVDYCFCGVDLGSTSDLTAVSFLFLHDEKFHFIQKYYLPEFSLSSHIDKEMYKDWHKQGLLTLTPGNVTDYDYITTDIMQVHGICPIYKTGYDKWNSVQWAINITQLGLYLEPFSQTLGNFNKPTKEFDRLVRSGKVVIDNNPITRFCFRNVVIKRDHNGNEKPDKSNNRKKIDGVISMLTALGVCLETYQV